MRRYFLCLLTILILMSSVGYDRPGKILTLRKNTTRNIKVRYSNITTPMKNFNLCSIKIQHSNTIVPMKTLDLCNTKIRYSNTIIPMKILDLCNTKIRYSNTIIPMKTLDLCNIKERRNKIIKPMEALDRVMKKYAANFEKVSIEHTEEYYYKLPDAQYYLFYEGTNVDKNHVIHLYEFVIDDPVEEIGHTITYGWYLVDRKTGKIIDNTQ